MCKVSESIFMEGREEGRLEQARDTAICLADMGFPVEKIAKAVRVTVSTVTQWLNDRTITAQQP